MPDLVPHPVPGGVVVEESGGDSLRIVFRPARAEGAGSVRVFFLVWLIVWTLGAVVLTQRWHVGASGAPGAWLVVSAWLIGLFVLIAVVSEWALWIRIRLHADELRVTRSVLFVHRTRVIRRRDLVRLEIIRPDPRDEDRRSVELVDCCPKPTRLLWERSGDRASRWLGEVLARWSGLQPPS